VFFKSPRLFFPLFFCALLFLCSCRRSKLDFIIDLDYSVNVARPGRRFPSDLDLSQAKREVHEILGNPNFIRFWWTEDGRIHRFLEVDRRLKDPRSVYQVKHSWIYLDKNIECVFDTDTTYREIPLSDKVRTVCTYGDPEDIKKMSDHPPLKENWNYYSIGLILKFEDDRLVKTQRHPPMGTVIKR